MIYKNLNAFHRKDIATLVGVTSYVNYDYSEERYEFFKNRVEIKADVVLIPVKYSLEEYREEKDHIATYCKVTSVRLDNDNKTIVVGYSGEKRCRVVDFRVEGSSLFVDIELLDNQIIQPEHKDIVKEIFDIFKEYIKYDNVWLDVIEEVRNPKSIEKLIENIVIGCRFEVDAKRKLVAELDATKRLEILKSELELRLLEQQSEKGQDLIIYYKRIINELDISTDIKRVFYDELKRLKVSRPGNSEYANIIDWLDRFIALPWNKVREENNDIDLARKILDESHYGMNDLKEKIIDYIALKNISGKNPSQILCLYGPPGVGKSTISRSIAKALNKDFYGFSLGGITNPEEINGMKRFFVGAKPGRILEGIERAQSKNCVIMLDEIDKMISSPQHGDPYSVLLEVLDKNQNKEFKDRYFDIPFDLSQVMFIATANDLTTIPEPLKNRMEILLIEGYSLDEKVKIARDYILNRALKEIGVEEGLIKISDDDLATIIEDYTFESGVRQVFN